MNEGALPLGERETSLPSFHKRKRLVSVKKKTKPWDSSEAESSKALVRTRGPPGSGWHPSEAVQCRT